jgi:hypothetical protein
MNTLTYKELNTILNVLEDAKREHASITYRHDLIVKEALKGNKEKLEYLMEIQEANYAKKMNLENTFYAIQAIINEFE